MNILLAILQILFSHLNENIDRLEKERQKRDLDDPVIVPPVRYDPIETEVEIVDQNPIVEPATVSTSRETPGLGTETIATTDLNINLYSEPWCGDGLYKIPAMVKDIILTVSILMNLVCVALRIKKALALRRRRRLAAQNHPINRPILGQFGKFLKNI